MKKYRWEILGALLCLGLGMFTGFTVKGDGQWYQTLHKPSFNPPSWLFGPVWSVLYVMMGTILGKLWQKQPAARTALLLFYLQLLFNLLWSPLFFHLHRLDLALIDICLLWFSLLACMWSAKNLPLVLQLFLPYFFWVSFALVLNGCLYLMNN
jgi:tryptophan-rich sensory protein